MIKITLEEASYMNTTRIPSKNCPVIFRAEELLDSQFMRKYSIQQLKENLTLS